MMKIQFQTKFTQIGKLVLILNLNISGEYALAESARDEKFVTLPAIDYNLEINLDNLFRENNFRQESGQLNMKKPDQVSHMQMQLVGTLIMGEKRLAWIKIDEYEFHMLGQGQRVPDSKFLILRIHTDSVELVNIDECTDHSFCKFRLVLDLN